MPQWRLFTSAIYFRVFQVTLILLFTFCSLGAGAWSADAMPKGDQSAHRRAEGERDHDRQMPCPKESKGRDFFVLPDGSSLKRIGGKVVDKLLSLIQSRGTTTFGSGERRRYCALKEKEDIQWVLNDLETGEVISQSKDTETLFFGASASKIFVAAALLDKQNGKLTPSQLVLMSEMIVKSSNTAWIELQKQAGDGISADSGRKVIDQFTRKMGYKNIRAFQGWWQDRIHGNELNAQEVSRFLYDTYHGKYPGAEVLWKLMYACKTGARKGNYYMPKGVFIGGKTGTYHGPNASPRTIKWDAIRAHNHIMIFNIGGTQYGLSILSNRGSDQDVAILAGGLVREFIHNNGEVYCRPLTGGEG